MTLVALLGCGHDGSIASPDDCASMSALRVPPSGVRGSHVLYLNFDGAQLHPGNCSDSRTNCTFIVREDLWFPAFRCDRSLRQEIVDRVAMYFSAYDVQLVTSRPTSGHYTMALVGGRGADLGRDDMARSAGFAPLDCGDVNLDDIAVVFGETAGNDPELVATTVAQEVGHTYGLGHTDAHHDIMYPELARVEARFADLRMHSPDGTFCPGVVEQNSHEFMLRALGSRR